LSPGAAPHTPDPLYQFADLNAFLTLAATRHTLLREDLLDNPRVDAIVSAARAGRVPIRLVSSTCFAYRHYFFFIIYVRPDLSEKNPLESVPDSASLISLLELFSRGAHRVLVRASDPATGPFLGIVSDRRLLAWFAAYAPTAPFLATPLHSLSLPSMHLFSAVVTATSTSSVLDAMRLMSEEGVSSIAVLDDDSGVLLSAVSVTDIGRIVVPSQSNQILSTPLNQFVSLIKAPDGSTDGVDRYPGIIINPLHS
jgi:CBS domain-containing protein